MYYKSIGTITCRFDNIFGIDQTGVVLEVLAYVGGILQRNVYLWISGLGYQYCGFNTVVVR